jgi:ribosomal protein L7Ae-like RNA K-turn-binding protein
MPIHGNNDGSNGKKTTRCLAKLKVRRPAARLTNHIAAGIMSGERKSVIITLSVDPRNMQKSL